MDGGISSDPRLADVLDRVDGVATVGRLVGHGGLARAEIADTLLVLALLGSIEFDG